MIRIHWAATIGNDDPKWGWSGVLYAYLAPDAEEILYVGKADGATSTVHTRWKAVDKMGFWRDLERQRGIWRHATIVGAVDVGPCGRLTRQLLADLESLLIKREGPWGNLQGRKTRNFSRPFMEVRCSGFWPGRRQYRDQ
jgi:hypothetical protein